MWIESMTESGSSRFSTRFGDRRTVMNGSTMAIRPWRARAVTAAPLASQRGRRAGLVERDAGEHLAAVEAVGGDGVGVVAR